MNTDDKSHSDNGTKPIGIFGWFGGRRPSASMSSDPVLSPCSVSSNPLSETDEHPRPLENVAKDLGRRSSAAKVTRPRKDSSSLTHDEALNISRANARSPTNADVTPLSPRLSNASGKALNRPRSNSKYEKLGLITAYSGGPSSF